MFCFSVLCGGGCPQKKHSDVQEGVAAIVTPSRATPSPEAWLAEIDSSPAFSSCSCYCLVVVGKHFTFLLIVV